MARFIRILSAMARETGRIGPRAARVATGAGLTQPCPAVSFGPTLGILWRHSGVLMTAAFTFPGQGSQAVGLGKALAEAFPSARAVFGEDDAALGCRLAAIRW